ncbi:hypothetical protein HZB01_05580 [Candidatus Woesearchaeota archaeon]|nr:hypothetical protein [Candidatus Woesearchaeota archaeon]
MTGGLEFIVAPIVAGVTGIRAAVTPNPYERALLAGPAIASTAIYANAASQGMLPGLGYSLLNGIGTGLTTAATYTYEMMMTAMGAIPAATGLAPVVVGSVGLGLAALIYYGGRQLLHGMNGLYTAMFHRPAQPNAPANPPPANPPAHPPAHP